MNRMLFRRRLFAMAGLVATFASSVHPIVAQPSGQLAEFRFDGDARNFANGRESLNSGSIQFTSDRFDAPRHALASPESGFVGSLTHDYLKSRPQWTWSAWIRSDSPEQRDRIIYSEDALGNVLAIGLNDSQFFLDTYNSETPGRWSRAIATGKIAPGTWHHVAVTFASNEGNVGECHIYMDGQIQFVGGLPGVKADGAGAESRAFALGRNIGSVTAGQVSQDFIGAIDEVIIFERALTAAEVPGLLVPLERLTSFVAVELEFFARSGIKYQLQWSTDLQAWTNEGAVVVGENKPVIRFASTRQQASRYWRLQPVN